MTAERALFDSAGRWLAAGRPAMQVLVLETRGSVPRESGTRMLVSAEDAVGTIGGGHLELKAIAFARELMRGGIVEPQDRHYPLGPALGQCCGGALTLRTQPLTRAIVDEWSSPPPLFFLQLYGAGHVGRAIVHALEPLDARVQWIDERASAFPSEPSATHIERVCVEPVEAEVDVAPTGAFYLVLTHSHDLDQRITEAILRRGDFGYLGLIGSATKRARFMHRFDQRGFDASTLSRITCPIGVPGIAGKQPATIAVAVVAQLLQQAGCRPAG